jgi:hypothetical protein
VRIASPEAQHPKNKKLRVLLQRFKQRLASNVYDVQPH